MSKTSVLRIPVNNATGNSICVVTLGRMLTRQARSFFSITNSFFLSMSSVSMALKLCYTVLVFAPSFWPGEAVRPAVSPGVN